ncbi:serine/threonine protein kinase [Stieleria sp. TO1_6]|uniref:serine/threonine-protein kinase n=1 Tax=Stieleria tagensis TaxID=2956795 RepID=UPI00209B999F|nr:serine/threonine-protein kinase [Stieleria tagensis]MCO8125500.1 serine/threonine protein kinase [Stieleria tagensis]
MSDKSSTPDLQFAETMAGQAADDSNPADDHSREQSDIALAALALRSGKLNERQLSESLSSWTIHGSVALGDHLVTQGLLDDSAKQDLSKEAAAWLAANQDQVSRGPATASESAIINTLESIDPSGKIARLMGIQAAAASSLVDAEAKRTAMLGYRLVRKIGQGGLGRVWLAFDENLKRHVAIKEIARRDNDAALERFRREAEITGHLEHPGIVPVYQLGTDQQSGQAFYAMRFLGKSTLHDSIGVYHERKTEGDDDPMLIRQLLTDFVNVCQAIGHAHSRKVIHRDLKPENIAIDSFGQVIVIDWGIAKVIDELNTKEMGNEFDVDAMGHDSTMQGQVLGTPMYMAPEQAAGRIDELDERTDIYGLGGILFAILTGVAPHETTRAGATDARGRSLLSAIASQPTPNPLAVDPTIDHALAAICCKAMARKQYARYQSASALADDVQRWMAGQPVSAHQETFVQRGRRWINNHSVLSQAIGGGLIVAAVTLVTLAIAARQNRLAANNAQFDRLATYDTEIKIQLQSTAVALIQNARFMSTLPPIQAIIDARGTQSSSGEGEPIWQERLETIFEGLLRANPNYLSASYTAVSAEQTEDVVRVARRSSESGYIRRVPHSRLTTGQVEAFANNTIALSPGDVLLTAHRPADDQRTDALQMGDQQTFRRTVRLTASTPVFDDQSGECFGMVVVETDFLSQIVQFLDRVGQSTATIMITDSNGQVWVSDDPSEGVEVKKRDLDVTTIIPELSPFLADFESRQIVNREQGWMANRITLDPANPQTVVSVVMKLSDRP